MVDDIAVIQHLTQVLHDFFELAIKLLGQYSIVIRINLLVKQSYLVVYLSDLLKLIGIYHFFT